MLAEIYLLRLESSSRDKQNTERDHASRFVPLPAGVTPIFKETRERDRQKKLQPETI